MIQTPFKLIGILYIHHLILCQTVTLCRGSRPQTPSRESEMTQPPWSCKGCPMTENYMAPLSLRGVGVGGPN